MVIERAEGQTLGLGLHQIDESVAINEIKPDGAVKAHNAANPSAPVALHDVLRSDLARRHAPDELDERA